ncbi:sensor histidine kinase [Nocardia terpenica]|nr:HAMP domain-containing sensor histidine kinase [Nocardia terpenica]
MVEGLRQRITAIAPSLTYPPDQATLDQIRDDVGGSALVMYGLLSSRAGPDLDLVSADLRAAVRDQGRLLLQRVAGPKLVIGAPIVITGGDGSHTRSDITIFAVLDLSGTQAQIANSARAAALTSALALPLAAALALVAAQSVLRPVRELRGTARRLANGDLSARSSVRGSDELAELAHTVDEMAMKLEQSVGRLRESEAQSRRFVADVSHELRTPLAALAAVVEVLEAESGEMTPDQRTSALLAVTATRRLTSLVADLMEISRFDADAEHVRLEHVEVRQAIRDTLHARGWHQQVTLDAAEPIEAVLDRRRLDVVVANLVGNALTHGAPPVVVSLHADERRVTITVVDHGSGLPLDDPDRVFGRFYKADPSRSSSQGSGLGLAIARENARLHGGDILADNAPEAGARFIATFAREPLGDQ